MCPPGQRTPVALAGLGAIGSSPAAVTACGLIARVAAGCTINIPVANPLAAERLAQADTCAAAPAREASFAPTGSMHVIAVTERSAHALQVLTELALADGEVVSGPEITRRRELHQSASDTIMPLLRDGGLVSAQRGIGGGYLLAREPTTITVAEIVELIDGPLDANTEGIFTDASRAIRDTLASRTVADCADSERREAQARAGVSSHMYYI